MKDKKQQMQTLLKKWRNSISDFAIDMFGFKYTEQQDRLFNAILNNRKIACKSGHGTGKSTAMAVVVLWSLTCLPKVQVVCTAPTSEQLRNVLWSRLHDLLSIMIPEFKSLFKITQDRLQHTMDQSAFAVSRTARSDNPDALQGFHAENLILIADEAAGIHDSLFAPIMGAMTQEGNRVILIGNPTRKLGFFYESCNDPSWTSLTLNAEESDLVSKEQISYWREKYGEDSDEYRVRVLGDFPMHDSNALFDLNLIEDSIRSSILPDDPVVWGVDVAGFGQDDSVIAKRYGNVIKSIEIIGKRNVSGIANYISYKYSRCLEKDRPVMIYVDVIGIGAGVYSRLKELNIPVREVVANEVANNPKRFINKRAEMYCDFRDKLESHSIKIPDDQRLKDEILSIEYLYDKKGRYQLVSKQDMRRKGIKSPDMSDAVVFCFYEPIFKYRQMQYETDHYINRQTEYESNYTL